MAGTHQLWTYDIAADILNNLAGNGREALDDGYYPNNALAQPSGLSALGSKLYFVDAETSSLRVLEDNKVTTLIGKGLFDFGFRDGPRDEALMQHPIGVFANEEGVYVADSFNHVIRLYDPQMGKLSTYIGTGEQGYDEPKIGKATFNEPNDIIKINGTFYVTDTNNHKVRIIDAATRKVSTLKLHY